MNGDVIKLWQDVLNYAGEKTNTKIDRVEILTLAGELSCCRFFFKYVKDSKLKKELLYKTNALMQKLKHIQRSVLENE